VAMFNVHALGGEAMVAAAVRGARQGAEETGGPVPTVLAVTVLSSLSGESLATPVSLAFEATSVLILVAMVGAVLLAAREEQR